ncbi:MAG: DUF4418 family protein [Lachnospiraceae bacterium]|nr:DUF4418 family protein [Lachnospiraceae bacterium]
MKKNNPASVIDVIILLLCLLLTAGIKLVFHACAPKEDGSWMTCHWAEQAVFAIGVAMVIQALALLLYDRQGKHGVKAGISFALAIQGIICAVLPGILINLCMMQDMRCHTLMRPAVIVLCILTAACAIAGCVRHRAQCGAHHHGEEPS